MYIPEAFKEERTELLHDLIRQHSFGTLVSQTEQGLVATHIPFLVDPERGPLGTLRGHVARANDHWRALADDAEVLVMFQGPHAYVTPSWYTTPMAVPTWNYVAVHAYGRPRLIQDGEPLRQILDDTVATFEAAFDYKWRPPEGDFVANLARNVVGIELELTRLEGKLKLSQNRSKADQAGVIGGLRARAEPTGVALAELMAART
jgi:transcriptional regulator